MESGASGASGTSRVIRLEEAGSREPEEKVPAALLRVAGITPFTTIDFPGKLSAVAFLQGCPWRCVYCQNPWMQPAEFSPELEHDSWERLESLLMRRKGLLDGVVFRAVNRRLTRRFPMPCAG